MKRDSKLPVTQCPACRIPLDSQSLHGKIVLGCNNCQGIWFEGDALGVVVRQVETSSVDSGVVAKSEPLSNELDCPKCKETLTCFEYAEDSQVQINKCAKCSGLWLRDGQLQQIVRYRNGHPGLQELGDLFADRMKPSDRRFYAKRIFRSKLLSGAVAASYFFVELPLQDLRPGFHFRLAMFLILPLACIWFSKLVIMVASADPELNASDTPENLLVFLGWCLLFSPLVGILIAKIQLG